MGRTRIRSRSRGMSDDHDEPKLSLKVMVNKENNKVLFAEADADFADVLLSFLTLPLGKIIRLINNRYGEEAPALGSLTNIYNSLPNLDELGFRSAGGKQMLLDPASSFTPECSNLKINVDDTQPANKYFKCGNVDCGWKRRHPLIVRYHDMLKCHCGEFIKKPMGVGVSGIKGDFGVFMKKGLKFLITDDLKMVPVVPDSIIQTLFNLGVTITDGAQIRTVSFGLNEVIDLLRSSLLSSTPLTDVVFNHKIDKMDGSVTGDSLRHRTMKKEGEESSLGSKKMILNALISKSDHSLYTLVANGDFVDFLVSLLAIPLGGVEWILGGDTGLKSIDNLYRSVQYSIDENFFGSSDMRRRLMKPKLPPGYLSRNHVFSLKEEVNPMVCYYFDESVSTEEINSWMHFKDPKGGDSFVESSTNFLVGNDLTVTYLNEFSMSVVRGNSFFKELELHIGLGEALDILRASLTSGLALKECVANLISEKLNNK